MPPLCWVLVKLLQVLCPLLPSSSQNVLEARQKNSSQCFGKSSVVSGEVESLPRAFCQDIPMLASKRCY